MPYDESSFLQGIAIGRSLRGYLTINGVIVEEDDTPTCWNDKGQYDHFYIDYHQPISTVTYGQFTACHFVFQSSGALTVSDVEIYNPTTLKIYCNFNSSVGNYIGILNYDDTYLTYSNGLKIEKYGILFWVNDLIPYNIGYFEDYAALEKVIISGSENAEFNYMPSSSIVEFSDTATLTIPSFNIEEELIINYS